MHHVTLWWRIEYDLIQDLKAMKLVSQSTIEVVWVYEPVLLKCFLTNVQEYRK